MITIRRCAQAIIEQSQAHGDDPAALRSAIRAPLAELIERDDLVDLGIPRQGNNVDFSRYLYFDGQLSILLFEVPDGKTIPPHDHGVWEAFCVYRGHVRHKVYRRIDDGTVEGYAELDLVADDVLTTGDLALVAPPADIHSFTALHPRTLGLTVVDGPYKEDRLYYRPEENTYVVRKQANRH